ncbi:hypothetical protein ACTXT7_007936 [Hymenolepis weldensis]
MALQLPTDFRRPERSTISLWPSFNPEQDAKDLHEVIIGSVYCEGLAACNYVGHPFREGTAMDLTSNIIPFNFDTCEQNLERDLEQGLSGNFENVVRSTLKDVPEMKAIALRKAMKGLGTTEQVLIQILSVASNNEIQQIKEAYMRVFECDLETDMANETSEDFQSIMLLLLKAERNEDPIVDQARVINDAFMIYKYGKRIYATEEGVLTKILTSRSFAHIKLLTNYYKQKYGKTLSKIIYDETSGDHCQTLLSIVKPIANPSLAFKKALEAPDLGIWCRLDDNLIIYYVGYAEDPATLYASWIYDSLKVMGTNDDDLIRLILSRAEIDLQNIKEAYHKMAEKTLIEDIEVETSGDFKNMLIALVKGNFEEIPGDEN